VSFASVLLLLLFSNDFWLVCVVCRYAIVGYTEQYLHQKINTKKYEDHYKFFSDMVEDMQMHSETHIDPHKIVPLPQEYANDRPKRELFLYWATSWLLIDSYANYSLRFTDLDLFCIDIGICMKVCPTRDI